MTKSSNRSIKSDAYTILNFQDVAKKVNTYLKEDNISLTFQGYRETIRDYLSLQDNDIDTAYNLIIDCNLWGNYLNEIEGIIQAKMLNSQLYIDILKADQIKKVENPELNEKIKKENSKYLAFKLFYKQLKAQQRFLLKAYYHCMRVYNSSSNKLTYKIVE